MEQITLHKDQDLQLVAASNSLESAYDRFVKFADVSPKSRETYKRNLRQFFRFLALQGCSEPTRETILEYKGFLIKRGLKATSVFAYLAAVKVFFQWAELEGIFKNVSIRIKAPKISRDHKKDYLTAGQLKTVIEGIDLNRDRAAFLLMAICGLRTIEISRANVEDLRALGEKTVLYVHGKGRSEKTDFVIIPDTVEKEIRSYLATRQDVKENDPLFVAESNFSKGQRLSTRTVSGIAKSALQKAGFSSERLTAHSLRHSAVTAAIVAGKPLYEVQQFARHSNISTTMIYNHSLERTNNGCSAAIESAVFG